jgi:DNA-binding CsgD family transcriptional regulator
VVGAWPFVGRERELDTIGRALDAGESVVVVGAAGAGKTALLREVARQVEEAGAPCGLVVCTATSELPLPVFTAPSTTGRARREGVSIVDDAHLLDEGSAEVLWRLATEADRTVIAVRSGERLPERVARLVADGSCTRVDLSPLTRPEVHALLERALGGDVEDRLTHTLLRRAQGNLLLLRELVRGGVESGAVAHRHGIWGLDGELPVAAGVADVVRAALVGLDEPDRAAAELIAVGEPLAIDVAEAVIGTARLEAVEATGIVTLVDTVHGPAVTVGHPLFGDVLRLELGGLRRRRYWRGLVDGASRVGSTDPYDRLRALLWRLELGDLTDPQELLDAALLARPFGGRHAELLARRAVDAGGPVEAVLVLAELVTMNGQMAEAQRLLDPLAQQPLSPDQAAALEWVEALLHTEEGQLGDVEALISASPHTASTATLQALSAQSATMQGRVDEAMALAQPLLESAANDPIAIAIAGASVAVAGGWIGRPADSERALAIVSTHALEAATRVPYAPASAMMGTVVALLAAGRLDQAEQLSDEMYRRALADDDQWLTPRGASGLAMVALMRGQPHTALRYMRTAINHLYGFDAMFLRYNLGYLAQSAALAGDLEEATAAIDAPESAPRLPLFEADWEIAEATVLAALGELTAATDRALHAARSAATMGHWTRVGIAAADAARYSESHDAAQLAATAAAQVDGPFLAGLAHFAAARLDPTGRALVAASDELEALGLQLLACEAAYAAARALRRNGDGSGAVAAACRAADLHGRCENARIPWVAGFDAIEVLTPREQHIALLAASGHPDANIAELAHISIRTVQNHLTHAYRKLGITSRKELPEALSTVID